VGKDVDQIIRDLMETSLQMAKTKAVEKIKQKVHIYIYMYIKREIETNR